MENIASEKQVEILRLLADPENAQASQARIGQSLGISQQRVADHLDVLEDRGLVEIDESPKLINIKRLTREGFETATHAGRVVSFNKEGEDEHLNLRLHRFICKFEIDNPNELEGAWVERYLTSKPVRHRYNPENKCYEVFAEKYTFRISQDNVFIHLHDLRGDDAHNLKNRAWIQVLQAKDWLENNSPIRLHSPPNEIEAFVNEQHIAILREPFAEMVNDSDVDLDEVKICDQDTGEIRLKIDASTGVPELESENLKYGESDIDQVKSFYEWAINNDGFDKIKEVVEHGILESQRASRRTQLARELEEFSSKWIDNHGNLMGWSIELEKPVKIIPKEEL